MTEVLRSRAQAHPSVATWLFWPESMALPEPASAPRDGHALTREEFAERYQAGTRTLWTLAAGVLGGPDEAEDILQEAYVAAAAKRDQFQRGTNFIAWVARFVRNLALNERRK